MSRNTKSTSRTGYVVIPDQSACTRTEHDRWLRARAHAERQGCTTSAALEYADWIIGGLRTGHILLPARHSECYPLWNATR